MFINYKSIVSFILPRRMKSGKRKPEKVETEEGVKKKVKPNPTKDPPANSFGPSASSLHNLHALLDFSSLQDESAISHRFDQIARLLIHEYHLVVNNTGVETAFEIQEMEFYLQKAKCHEDPFTHGSEEQKISGRWYFHRAPRRSNDASRSSTSLTGYRGGTRKGLDLTIGGLLPTVTSSSFSQPAKSDAAEQDSEDEQEDRGLLRGGILLRSLRGIPGSNQGNANSKSESVSGPSLIVDKILGLSGASSIAELVENIWGRDTSALNPPSSSSASRTKFLYLKHVPQATSELPRIYQTPRIGIDLSHPGTSTPTNQSTLMELHPRIRFLPKTYRYLTRPGELTKGRPQTFYALIHTTLEAHPRFQHRPLSGDKNFRDYIVSGLGLKDSMVKKYLVEYESGKSDGLVYLKECIGKKGAADSPATYLKMMGALDALLGCVQA